MNDQIDKLLEDTEQHLGAILASARKQAAANPTKGAIEAAQAAEVALREHRDNKTPSTIVSAESAPWGMVQE